MNNKVSEICWICGNVATTGEHLVKKSDLREVFGVPSPGEPLYLHNSSRKNVRIQGLNSKSLKLNSKLCAKCNNETTQPYDKAWERLSKHIRSLGSQLPKSYIRANKVFPNNSRRQMRDVQLYFVKLFGCLIHENKVPLDIKSFSTVLLERTFHPNVFLKVGYFSGNDKMVGVAGLSTTFDKQTNEIVLVHWFYELGEFAVNIIYALDTNIWESTESAWLPQHGTSRMIVHDFSSELTRK